MDRIYLTLMVWVDGLPVRSTEEGGNNNLLQKYDAFETIGSSSHSHQLYHHEMSSVHQYKAI